MGFLSRGLWSTINIMDEAITKAKLEDAVVPSRGAASGAEALRALGVSAGNAAAGLHSPQHSWDGVDPIPSQPICFLRRPSGMGSMLASNTITWFSGASTNSTMWSASDPTKISIPTPGLYVFASTFELVYTCGDANFVSSESVYKSGNLVFIYFGSSITYPTYVTAKPSVDGFSCFLTVAKVN